jgi:hypothetical protein
MQQLVPPYVAVQQPNGAAGGTTVAPSPDEIFAGNASASAAADAAGQLSLYTAGIPRTFKVTGLQDVAVFDVYVATHSNATHSNGGDGTPSPAAAVVAMIAAGNIPVGLALLTTSSILQSKHQLMTASMSM